MFLTLRDGPQGIDIFQDEDRCFALERVLQVFKCLTKEERQPRELGKGGDTLLISHARSLVAWNATWFGNEPFLSSKKIEFR